MLPLRSVLLVGVDPASTEVCCCSSFLRDGAPQVKPPPPRHLQLVGCEVEGTMDKVSGMAHALVEFDERHLRPARRGTGECLVLREVVDSISIGPLVVTRVLLVRVQVYILDGDIEELTDLGAPLLELRGRRRYELLLSPTMLKVWPVLGITGEVVESCRP